MLWVAGSAQFADGHIPILRGVGGAGNHGHDVFAIALPQVVRRNDDGRADFVGLLVGKREGNYDDVPAAVIGHLGLTKGVIGCIGIRVPLGEKAERIVFTLIFAGWHDELRWLWCATGVDVEANRFTEKLRAVTPLHPADLFNLHGHRCRDADGKALIVWAWHGFFSHNVRKVLRSMHKKSKERMLTRCGHGRSRHRLVAYGAPRRLAGGGGLVARSQRYPCAMCDANLKVSGVRAKRATPALVVRPPISSLNKKERANA